MSHDWDDEPVGYKKPPRWTQFRKGQSGNPKGRPPKSRPGKNADPTSLSALDALLRAELDREIVVNDASGRHKMPMQHVIVRAQITNAAKGNVHAQRDVLRQTRELEVREAENKLLAEEIDRQAFAYILARRGEQSEVWEAARESGAEPVHPWPHPDDIFIDHANQKWRIRGPWDEADLPLYEYMAAMRDVTMLRWEIEVRAKKSGAELLLLATMIYDVQLPRRWQCLQEERWQDRTLFSLSVQTLTQLKKRLKAAKAEVERLEASGARPALDKDTYRKTNAIMKPALKLFGYRSLAHFENAHEHISAMSLPRSRIGAV